MAQADFTIADVLAWARTKPASKPYKYGDVYDCALCQFLKDTGRAAKPLVGPFDYDDMAGEARSVKLPARVDDAVSGRGEYQTPYSERHTFGRLVKRLEALCPDTPITTSNWAAIDAYLADIEQVDA